MKIHRKGRVVTVLFLMALLALGLSAGAQAKLTGPYTRFAQCPYKNPLVFKCIVAVTNSGEVVLGSKTVPIVNPVTLQGGFGEPVEEKEEAEFYSFYGATNGVTLSKAPQPVPGGLAGIVNCKEIKEFFLRISCELTFENGVTGLNSTLELAKPASAIKISENNLAGQIGTALQMPVKVHLENPFLGKNCYVGSEGSPITWNLTTGTTSPPAPNTPITGKTGKAEFLEEGSVLVLKPNKLVDNKWSAPAPSGCGGILSFLVTPIISAQLGTTTAGHNTAILEGTLNEGSAFAINENNKENP